ncbi:MAG: GTPase Era [Bacilli bacterium]|nr:GTPase Era [Bacilli bacterium]
MKKVGFVTVYGRANAGKSTIINKCLGYKLLPVSSKPQTTRDNVKAIYNDEDSQIIFVDTPGVFKPHGKLGSILLRDAESAKEGVDCIVYVIDASEVPNFELCQKLQNAEVPIIIAYNKVDLVKANVGEERLARYVSLLPKAKVVRMSAKDNFGIDILLSEIKDTLQEGYPFYGLDMATDRPKEYIISEIVREKCMRLLSAEVPHSIAIDIKSVDYDDEENVMSVYGNIIVEKQSEKAIVIGKKGAMISEITRYSSQSMASFFGCKVDLNLVVKVIPDWRNDERYLKKFGYDESL